MSLRFRYQLFPGRGVNPVRPRPVIPVTLVGASGFSLALDAIVDPAADDTVFPDAVATALGIDLTGATSGMGAGAGLVPVPLRYADIKLRLFDLLGGSNEQREWTARVGFTAVKFRHPLLGFAGFLQFFDALFLGERQELELRVNNLYPGT